MEQKKFIGLFETFEPYINRWLGNRSKHIMEMTGNVVIEKNMDSNKALRIVCPECGAPAKAYCDPERSMIHASRIAQEFAVEAAPLTGPFEE